jgi:uncharacterized membrane protein YcaP (DUF421 family)
MDPLRIIVRVVVAYIILLGLVRLSGKRTIKQGSPFDFTVALIVGDIVDNYVWGEVATGEFVVAATVLLATHVVTCAVQYRLAPRAS